jgi:hypothetical protein
LLRIISLLEKRGEHEGRRRGKEREIGKRRKKGVRERAGRGHIQTVQLRWSITPNNSEKTEKFLKNNYSRVPPPFPFPSFPTLPTKTYPKTPGEQKFPRNSKRQFRYLLRFPFLVHKQNYNGPVRKNSKYFNNCRKKITIMWGRKKTRIETVLKF